MQILGSGGLFAMMVFASSAAAFGVDYMMRNKPGRKVSKTPIQEQTGELMASLATKEQLFTRIRRANCWSQLEKDIRSFGYNLFPAEEDLFAVNFQTRDFLMLGDSGHFFPFLIERMGTPPGHLIPTDYRKVN